MVICDVSRKADSDSPMAEYKRLIASWKKKQIKLPHDMRSLCIASDTKVCQKLQTWLTHINGSRLGSIADRLPEGLAQILGMISEVELQKSAFLGMAQVLRHFFRFSELW